MTRFLCDADAQRDLERNGYVVVPGIAADDIAALRESFRRTHPEVLDDAGSGSGLSWSSDPAPGSRFTNDFEASFEHRDEIERLLHPHLERYIDLLFVDHRSLVSTFLMKWPGQASHLPLHQDPSFVREPERVAVTLWIALDDTSPDLANGPLHVLPGSHLMAQEYRGTNTASTFLAHLERIWPRTVPLTTRAGDAVVIDGRLIHGSPPNTTERPRLAMATAIAERDAELVHVVGLDDDQVVVMAVPEDFYRRTSPGRLHAHPPVPDPTSPIRPRAPEPFVIDALGV